MSYIRPTELSGNYLLDHWNGAQPLPQSYWINGTLISALAAVAASTAVGWFAQSGASLQATSAAILASTALLLAVTVWSTVGIWRSANRHVERGGSLGWANAAKAMMVLGGLSLLGQASNLAKSNAEFAQLAVNRDPIGPPAKVSLDNGLLRIEGNLAQGTAKAVARLVASGSVVRAVEISSPGGRIVEAIEIARLVRERKADTIAGQQCMSACTVVLLAGANRSSVGGANGFHQASFPGFTDAELAEMSAELRQSYIDSGLPTTFIDQALAHGADDMWFPGEAELFEAGVLNNMTPQRIIADNEASARQINEKSPTKVDDVVTLTGAKASGMTLIFTYKAVVDRALLDLGTVTRELKSEAQRQICSREMAPILLRSGAIFEHEYLDENGALITRYQITRCGGSA